MTDKPFRQRSLKAAAREGAKPATPQAVVMQPGPMTVTLNPGASATPPRTPIEELPAPGLVQFRCGHTRPVADFLHGNCAECRNKAMREKAQRRQEKRAQKPPDQSQRLPHGSVFHKTYSADTQTWTGALTVPVDDERFLTHPAYYAPCDFMGAALIFRAEASAEKKLEHLLDAMYRECVASVLGEPKP